MRLEELEMEFQNILSEIQVQEELQLGLERIKWYNRMNNSDDIVKAFSMVYAPNLVDITEDSVADKIRGLNDDLLKVSERINYIKYMMCVNRKNLD